MTSALRSELRAARLAQGLTQVRLIEIVHALDPEVGGFHSSSVAEWEKADSSRSPSAEQLDAWARALGFDLVLLPRAA